MKRTHLIAALATAALLTACSDKGNTVPDGTPWPDGPPAADNGPQVDTGGPVGDTGGPVGDTGGPVGDTGGPVGDAGPTTCDPNFGQPQACGGALAGTKWKYQEACVSPKAFDALKTNCPGITIGNFTTNITANSTLQFLNSGSLARFFSGKASSTTVWPQSCAKLGCKVLEGGIKLALVKWPGSTALCTAQSGGSCSCDVTINLWSFAAGTYTVSGGDLTFTTLGKPYPYYFCVSGGSLTYAGTAANTADTNVTYVLTKMP